MLEIENEHAKGALLGMLYLTKHAKAKTDSVVIAFAQLLELGPCGLLVDKRDVALARRSRDFGASLT